MFCSKRPVRQTPQAAAGPQSWALSVAPWLIGLLEGVGGRVVSGVAANTWRRVSQVATRPRIVASMAINSEEGPFFSLEQRVEMQQANR